MNALSRFLVDFAPAGIEGAAPPAPARLLAGLAPAPSGPASEPAAPVPDRTAEAVAAALAEVGDAHVAAIAALEERHASRIADARRRWAEGEGATLAAAFRGACATIEDELATAAAAALEPLIGAALRAEAVTGLRDAVADLVTAGTGAAIAVSGSRDLLDALSAALAAAGHDVAPMSFKDSADADVTVTADASTIRTRLGDWTRALQRRLGTLE